MRKPEPCTLETPRVRLEPMARTTRPASKRRRSDGELWNLRITSVPAPGETAAYIAAALKGQGEGHMLPFVVRDVASGKVLGTTRYHDIVPAVERAGDRLHLVRPAAGSAATSTPPASCC